ncbi:hypothetical protein KY289_016991 [Solanum tuberosum]|nr:hypothetical protein KY284_016776 [Solanum tuberosum]KAH0689633.1 hypothetical protein KY289_016991 [Solanum tuberosum]
MFQPVSAVKGEYNDLVMFNMQLGLGIARCSEEMFGMLSTCTYVQLINRGITDHFSRCNDSENDRVKLEPHM